MSSAKERHRTSCAEGASSPVPGDGQRSSRERANDLAALQARIALHSQSQADSILPWSTKRRTLRSSFGEGTQELSCLAAPPPSHFCRQHHKPRPATFPSEFRIGVFLPLASCFQHCPAWLSRHGTTVTRESCPLPVGHPATGSTHPPRLQACGCPTR